MIGGVLSAGGATPDILTAYTWKLFRARVEAFCRAGPKIQRCNQKFNGATVGCVNVQPLDVLPLLKKKRQPKRRADLLCLILF